jgi:anti-anti-sigma factor
MHHIELNHRIEANDILVIELRVEKLDASNAPALLRAVKPLIARWRKVVLDLAGVQFIDGIGLAALLYCTRYLKTVQGHLHLCELSHTMSQLCKLMRLHRTFTIHASCADAVKCFQGSQS